MTQEDVIRAMKNLKEQGKEWVTIDEIMPLVDVNKTNISVNISKLWKEGLVVKKRRYGWDYKLVEEENEENDSLPKSE